MMNVILPLLLLLSFQAQTAHSFALNSVFKLISYVSKLVPVIFDFKELVEDVINPAENLDTQILAVLENLQKVQYQIRNMLSDLQISVDFSQYLSQIANAQSAISSINEDFVKFQNTSDETERNLLRTKFIENYKSKDVDTHLWNLRERAKGTPIFSLDAMPPLLSRKLKCNMTGVRIFQRGYLSLMMNGYALKVIFTNMTGGAAESEVNDSIAHMNGSVSGLLTIDKTCMDNYPEYVIKDLEGINSVELLHKTVQEKYTWFEAFIVKYKKRGFRYNAIYTNYSRINNVFQTESENRVMVFCEKKGNGSACDETKFKISQDISKYQGARTGDRDNEAAKHIRKSIQETTSSLRIYPYAIIIFADHPDFEIKDIVTGYCANDVYFTILYDTVYEHSDLVWERRTYSNVKYHVHIFLPTQVIDQPVNGSNPNYDYKQQESASFKAKASIPLVMLLVVFFLYFGT